MALETSLEHYPKKLSLKDGFSCEARPLRPKDEQAFFEFFQAVPERERMFIKHRVNEPEVIRQWCQSIDLGRNLPLLAIAGGRIVADCTLHQQLGGWKRHIGRVSILVHKDYRNRGLARALLAEVIDIAAERERLGKAIDKLDKEAKGLRAKLANPAFVARAPEEVVDESRARLEAAEEEMTILAAAAKRLAGL